ncbi:cyclin-D4-2-like [Olea europaea var. sylvestris]|uniref:Cyclin-D4-1-like n=1 Tax=Olea europaea subsp. europaea TaxID=158383 RepID=A0A8S0QII3_OLEEU|nr:cyclin-D4-2-like [Olea europaea var. sylvestris]CAA2965381.1 cyclin-D4-1-like [Olea europaea subsp. europaea]
MACSNSYECTASDLLCNEETKSLCFDDDDLADPFSDVSCQTDDNKGMSFVNGGPDSEPLIHLPILSEESVGLMVEREMEHMPRDDYLNRLRTGDLDMSVRREAVDWMCKAHAHYRFGALCLCLAINYFDRFQSVYDLPRGKTWGFQLLAVACLSLAAKMEEIEVPSTVDLQVGGPKFLFQGKTIRRMELLVLSILKWKMQAYTPFNFIDYFLRKVAKNDEFPSGPLIIRSVELILSTIRGIDLLEFRPSELAAAIAMYVSGEEIQAMDSFIGVEKGRVLKCLELIQDLKSINRNSSSTITANMGIGTFPSSSSSVPQSPNGVLEAAASLSYKIDERNPNSKRRRLD